MAVDLTTGATAWTRPASTRVGPAADGGRVFIVGDGELEAVDPGDGHSLWRVPLTGPAVRRPTARGGWVVLGLESGDTIALRADDGKTVWTAPLGGPPALDPVIEGDRLYMTTATRGLVAVDLVSGGVLWERPVDGTISALGTTPGAIYIGTTGRWFYAVDEKSGRVRWHWRVAGEPIGVGADDKVVATLMLDHTIRAFRAGNGAQAWREALQYRPFAGPIAAPAQWLVAGHNAVVRAYSQTDGTRAGNYNLPARGPVDNGDQLDALGAAPHVRLGPTVFDDLLVLVTQRGAMHGARRELTPPPTPVTVMPGVPVNAPAAPPTPATATPLTVMPGVPVNPPAAPPAAAASPAATTPP